MKVEATTKVYGLAIVGNSAFLEPPIDQTGRLQLPETPCIPHYP